MNRTFHFILVGIALTYIAAGPASPKTVWCCGGVDAPGRCQDKGLEGSVEELLREAAKRARQGHALEAQNLYYKVLELDPENETAHKGLGHEKFSPEKDLPAFKRYGEHRFLRDRLAPFKKREGAWLSKEAAAAFVREWNALRPELDRTIDENLNDPYLVGINRYKKQMLIRPFYQEIIRTDSFETGTTARPFALFIQHDRAKKRDYPERVEDRIAPALKDLAAFFSHEIAEPFGLERRPGFDSMALWVLNSHGEYDNQVRRLGRTILLPSRFAHYSPRLKEAITYWDEQEGDLFLHCVLHECVHFLCDAYAPGGIDDISSFWIVEGLAEYAGTASRSTSSSPYNFKADNRLRIAEFILGLKRLDGRWPLSLGTILGAKDLVHLQGMVEKAVRTDRALKRIDLVSWFYAASYGLCRYLDRERSADFRKYLKRDLAGEGGTDAFCTLFHADDLDALEGAITNYYAGDRVKWRPGKGNAEAKERRRKGKNADFQVPDQPPGPVGMEAMKALVEAHPEPVIVRACLRKLFYRDGPRKAAAFLEAVRGRKDGADLAAKLEADARMMGDLEAFLQRLFERMAGGDAAYRILDGREKYRIRSFDGAGLTVTDPKGSERTVPLGELNLKQFALAVKKIPAMKSDPATRLMLAHLLMLAGLEKEARSDLRRLGEAGKSRLPFCKAYEETEKHKRILDLLDCGDGEALPLPYPEMQKILSVDSPLIAHFRSRLEETAAYRIRRSFTDEALLKTRFASLCTFDPGRGLFRLAYTRFDEKALKDWKRTAPDCVTTLQDGYREQNPDLPKKGSTSIKEGKLSLLGDQVLVSHIVFDGDVSFTFEGEVTAAAGDQSFLHIVGIGQKDGQGAILCTSGRSLEIMDFTDRGAIVEDLDLNDFALMVNRVYRYRVQRKGDALTCTINGEKTASGAYPRLMKGRVFLWVAGKTPFQISSLELEGRVDGEWLQDELQTAVKDLVESLFKTK